MPSLSQSTCLPVTAIFVLLCVMWMSGAQILQVWPGPAASHALLLWEEEKGLSRALTCVIRLWWSGNSASVLTGEVVNIYHCCSHGLRGQGD